MKRDPFNHGQRTSSFTTSFTESEDPLRLSFGDLKEPGSDYEVIENNITKLNHNINYLESI